MTPEEREEAIEFLTKHFRYAGTYAACVKIRKLDGLTTYDRAACLEILRLEDPWYKSGCAEPIHRFERENPKWMIASDGRSNGYLVLYRMNPSRPGLRSLDCHVDEDEDFAQVDDGDLANRVAVVKAFDAACKEAVSMFLGFAREHEVVMDEEVTHVRYWTAVPRKEETDGKE